NWLGSPRRPTHDDRTPDPHLPVPSAAATGPRPTTAGGRSHAPAPPAPGPRPRGGAAGGWGAPPPAACPGRGECQPCHAGTARPPVARPRHADPQLAFVGARYSGNALVPAADRARPRPHSPASAPAADAGRGLERTAQALASLACQKEIGTGPLLSARADGKTARLLTPVYEFVVLFGELVFRYGKPNTGVYSIETSATALGMLGFFCGFCWDFTPMTPMPGKVTEPARCFARLP